MHFKFNLFNTRASCLFLCIFYPLFNLNQLDFESNLLTNNSWKFRVAKITGSFPILGFRKVTFPNLSSFWPILKLNDIIIRLYDVNDLTYRHFMIHYQKNLCTKFKLSIMSFFKNTSSTQNHNLVFHGFWFRS